jgi:hypothetical protein
MRRLGQPVSVGVALAYIFLGCRGTSLQRRVVGSSLPANPKSRTAGAARPRSHFCMIGLDLRRRVWPDHDYRPLVRFTWPDMDVGPPLASERLSWDGSDQPVHYELAKPLPTGQTELALTPLELLDRLAALIPWPRRHRHHYAGVFAPHAKLRARVTACAGQPVAETAPVTVPAADHALPRRDAPDRLPHRARLDPPPP